MIEIIHNFSNQIHKNDSWGVLSLDTFIVASIVNSLNSLDSIKLEDSAFVQRLIDSCYLQNAINLHPELKDEIKKDYPHTYNIINLFTRKDNETYQKIAKRILESDDEIAHIIVNANLSFVDIYTYPFFNRGS